MTDHPVVANLERTGWPDGTDPTPCTCPNCHRDLYEEDMLLESELGDTLGCMNGCIEEVVPDFPRICEACGELVGDDAALYVNTGSDVAVGCSLCCGIFRLYNREA